MQNPRRLISQGKQQKRQDRGITFRELDDPPPNVVVENSTPPPG
jgi:hypothetical protein